MKRFLWFLMIFGSAMVVPASVQADVCGTGEASTFVYPLPDWRQSCGFDVTCVRDHHMGIDGVPSQGEVVGAPVLAMCSGVVKDASEHGSYGGMVILECWTGSECVSPFVGHLHADTLQVQPGDRVVAGQTVLGYIAQRYDNGGNYAPHVHFGIRKGGYDSFNYNGCHTSPVWSYAGYPYGCYGRMLPDMHNPEVVLRDAQADLTDLFFSLELRHATNIGIAVGNPSIHFFDSGTTFPAGDNDLYVQHFDDSGHWNFPSSGFYDVFGGGRLAHIVRTGFVWYYLDVCSGPNGTCPDAQGNRTITCGPPTGEEYSQGRANNGEETARQDFQTTI